MTEFRVPPPAVGNRLRAHRGIHQLPRDALQFGHLPGRPARCAPTGRPQLPKFKTVPMFQDLVAKFTGLALASALFAGASIASAMELDRIVVVVEEDVITESELEDQMQRVRAQLRQQGTAMPPTAVLERQVMERLVLEKIQVQVAGHNGVEVSDDALNRAVSDIADRNELSIDSDATDTTSTLVVDLSVGIGSGRIERG